MSSSSGGGDTQPSADTAGGSLDERIARHGGRLTASEHRVAAYLREHVDEVAFQSAGELGASTGTSDATVIRTVKSLGYRGLPDLKRALRSAVKQRMSPAEQLSHSMDSLGKDPAQILKHALALAVDQMAAAARTVNPDAFRVATELVAGARDVVVLGAGPLGSVAEYLALRLSRVGVRAHATTTTGYLLADGLVNLREGDVLVVVTAGLTTPELSAALDHAHRAGASVVALTDTVPAVTAGRIAASLVVPTAPARRISAVSTITMLAEALVIAVAAQDPEGSLSAVESLIALRGRFTGEPLGEPGPVADWPLVSDREGKERRAYG
ncbi:MurR/RpiR family transcriptional regulator [Streptomyces sp.]|uniref:MurR/RpiR family transcriptional regulator n=1 Tax=Streptomyces sp. TaxID=1931 RepID=UPI002F3F044B